MFRKLLILAMLSFVFLGCERDLGLNIRYDQIQGLKKEARVLFEQNPVGTVTDVTYTADGDYIAKVSIRKEFANAATAHSRFFIITDPLYERKKAIEMTHVQKGGLPLQNGATVQGSVRASGFLDHLRDKVDKGIDGVRKQFDSFLDGLKNVPDSEDFKKLEQELNHLTEELRRSGDAAREKLQKEVLPKLREELEMLRERLREFGREKELEPLDEKMDEIRRI